MPLFCCRPRRTPERNSTSRWPTPCVSRLRRRLPISRPPARRFDKIEERIAYLAWVGEMSERLGNKVGDYAARVEFLKTLDYEAKRARVWIDSSCWP